MADKLILEILDQNWTRKAFTDEVLSCTITEELGQVGNADVDIDINNPAASFLPNPDAANPYEGRFRIYEDDNVVFAGVIDAHTKRLSSDGSTITFGGKQRGIELGFVNTGRVDYLGWELPDLFQELLRHNMAKQATLVSVTTQDDLYGAYQLTTGDPFKQNYWKSTTATPVHTATFDLGETITSSGIRVMPQWWKDIDTLKFHYHNFTVETSTDGSSWTTRGTKSDNLPSSAQGHLFTFSDSVRYFRINVTSSTDGFARIAQIMVYKDIATVGAETSYNVPFIENDDSGNCVTTGATSRPIVPGAFQGDGVITHSAVTRLGAGATITHTFRGTQNAVFFTSHTDGDSSCNIYVDGVLRESDLFIPNNRYWFKGYDTADDLGELTDGVHTITVEQTVGAVQVDYFNGIYRTSWRPIEADDPSIAYAGSWSEAEAAYFHNFFAAESNAIGNDMYYVFRGDRVRLIGSKGAGFGSFSWGIDGVDQGIIDCDTGTTQTNKEVLIDWSGSYGTHQLRVTHHESGKLLIDRLEGNFDHTLYIRARYETNLKVVQRMSEIIDSWLRFNHDGTVDLLGSVGAYGGTVIREGENDGGAIINANVENDYSETGSAVLAIVNVNGELPIKAFVIDKEAVAEIGYKLVKLEQSDAADQFLLNRQALQYLRERRKPTRSYDVQFDPDEVQGIVQVGETTRLYAPTVGLDGVSRHRVGKITTEYRNE